MEQDYIITEICPMCKSKMRHYPSYKDDVGGTLIETEYGLVCDKHGTIDYFAYGHWESETRLTTMEVLQDG